MNFSDHSNISCILSAVIIRHMLVPYIHITFLDIIIFIYIIIFHVTIVLLAENFITALFYKKLGDKSLLAYVLVCMPYCFSPWSEYLFLQHALISLAQPRIRIIHL